MGKKAVDYTWMRQLVRHTLCHSQLTQTVGVNLRCLFGAGSTGGEPKQTKPSDLGIKTNLISAELLCFNDNSSNTSETRITRQLTT